MKIIEFIKNLFKHECMFYEKEVMDLKQDPKCYKCGKPLSVAQAEKDAKMKRFLGKTTLVITFILVSITSYAQFSFEREAIILKTDTMTVRQAFNLLDKVVPFGYRSCDRVVIVNNQRYFKRMYLVNRLIMGKNKAYTERNGKVKLVRI